MSTQFLKSTLQSNLSYRFGEGAHQHTIGREISFKSTYDVRVCCCDTVKKERM